MMPWLRTGKKMLARLEQRLAQRRADGLCRELRMHDAAQGTILVADGKSRVNFCSNDYLGLAADADLAGAMAEGARTYGVGAGSAHLVCGHSRAHADVEAAMADWLGREQALLFSSGWLANLAVMTALLSPGDEVLQDRLNHASLLDGAKLAQARSRRYAHLDMDVLKKQLASRSTSLVVTDAVFSMDGDVAPLTQMADLCAQHGSWLMADDAHGLGVFGDEGRGCAATLGEHDLPVLTVTLGKAVGTQGACVVGSKTLIETIVQFARPYIYTTASYPALAAATLASIRRVRTESWRRERLQEHIELFRELARRRELPLLSSQTAIQPVMVGDATLASRLSARLWEEGFWVTAIRPPTVPSGTSRLRVTLSAAHTQEQIRQLVETMSRIWPDS